MSQSSESTKLLRFSATLTFKNVEARYATKTGKYLVKQLPAILKMTMRNTMKDSNILKKKFGRTSLFFLFSGALLFCSKTFANEADVLNVSVKCNEKYECNFRVRVNHKDKGWEHYANRWEILSLDGKVLATRELAHPHINEQPFTRSLTATIAPEHKEVRVRAHDSEHKYGGKEVLVRLHKSEKTGQGAKKKEYN